MRDDEISQLKGRLEATLAELLDSQTSCELVCVKKKRKNKVKKNNKKGIVKKNKKRISTIIYTHLCSPSSLFLQSLIFKN
jgi:hypothetical protein